MSRRLQLITFAIGLVFQPIFALVPTFLPTAFAADTEAASSCYQAVDQLIRFNEIDAEYFFSNTDTRTGSEDEPIIPSEGNPAPDSYEDPIGEVPYAQFNLSRIRNDADAPQENRDRITSDAYIQQISLYIGTDDVARYREPETGEDLFIVCKNADLLNENAFNPYFSVSPDINNILALIASPDPKIEFENDQDRAALLGENCVGGLISKPREDWTASDVPCPGFDVKDDIISNGLWDAPKVSPKVLQTLLYLVTDVSQGGAGREYIRVKKIVEPTGTLTGQAITGDSVVSTETTAADGTAEAKVLTGFTINRSDPPHLPTKLASAVQISAIDKVRATNKVIKKFTFGRSSKNYQYNAPYAIKVAWQTDAGLDSDPAPTIDPTKAIFSNAKALANIGIVEMLNTNGLGDFEIDTNGKEISSFGDVAELVGQSLFEQILNSPKHSLNGWDLTSTLESIGSAYIEQEFELPTGSLNGVTDFQSLVRGVGKRQLEKSLSLPTGSLDTKDDTSQQILESIGHRYIEDTLDIKQGSLTPSTGYSTTTVGDILERIGEGKLEQAFGLPKQSTRRTEYKTSNNSGLREGSFKAGLLFPAGGGELSSDDYEISTYVESGLDLAYVEYNGNGTDLYGFTAEDYRNPAADLYKAANAAALRKFKRLVGSRAIQTSIGQFHINGSAERIETTKVLSRTAARNGGALGIVALEGLDAIPVDDGTGRGDLCDNRRLNFSGGYTGSCSYKTVAVDSAEQTALRDIFNFLISPSIETRDQFSRNDAQYPEPKLTADYPGGNDKFNLDQLNWYNNPALIKDVPVNAFRLPERPSETTNGSIVAPPLSIRTAIDTDPVLSADADLQKRLSILDTLYTGYSQAIIEQKYLSTRGGTRGAAINPPTYTEYYTLDPLVGLSSAEVSKELIDRINSINAKPSISADTSVADYLAQYNTVPTTTVAITSSSTLSDTKKTTVTNQYAGWLFTLSDIKQRLLCVKSLGVYVPEDGLSFYRCVAASDEPTPLSAQTEALIDTVVAKIDLLSNQFKTLSETYYRILENDSDATGGAGVESLAGRSAMSAAVGLPGKLYKASDTGVISQADILFSRDPMRELFAPKLLQRNGKPSSVDLTAVVNAPDNYFPDKTVNATAVAKTQSTYFQLIGRLQLAKSLSNDPIAQRAFATQLETDLPTFSSALDNFSKLGIARISLEDKALDSEDLSRVFQLNLARGVYERLGKEQLLVKIWKRTGAQNTLTNNEGYQGIVQDINKLTQDAAFYKARLDTVSSKTRLLEQQASSLAKDLVNEGNQLYRLTTEELEWFNTDIQYLRDAATRIDTFKDKEKRSNFSDDVKDITNEHQIAIDDIQRVYARLLVNDPNNPYYARMIEIEQLVQDINQAIQEIIAGKELPRTQIATKAGDPNTALNTANQQKTCIAPETFLSLLTKNARSIQKLPGLSQDIKDFITEVGACKIDTALGLPAGALHNWYTLGKKKFPDPVVGNGTLITNGVVVDGVPSWGSNDWGVESLKLGIGLADYNSRLPAATQVEAKDASRLPANRIIEMRRRGGELLATGALLVVARSIPALRQFAEKTKLTEEDLVAILKGDVRPLVAKAGGPLLDKALQFPEGTTTELVYPTCREPNGTKTTCVKDPNRPGTSPDNMRAQTLAMVGFKKLGVTIPEFPANFDLSQGGNLSESWGNARITEALNLSANSFKGKLYTGDKQLDPASPVVSMNANGETDPFNVRQVAQEKLAQAFQIEAPYQRQLNELFARMATFTGLRTNLKLVLNEYQFKTTFELFQDPAGPYFTNDLSAAVLQENAETLSNTAHSLLYTRYLPQLWRETYVEPYSSTFRLSNGEVVTREVVSATEARTQTIALRKLLTETFFTPDKVKTFIEADYAQQVGPLSINPKIETYNYTEATFIDPQAVKTLTSMLQSRTRLKDLDQRFALNPDQSFSRFLKGEIDGGDITKNIGYKEAVGGAVQVKIDTWISESGPDWLKETNTAFKVYTKATCGSEKSFGEFMSSAIVGTKTRTGESDTNTCFGNDINVASGNEILYNPKFKDFRLLLFNKFVNKATSSRIEQDTGLRDGTLEIMVAEPGKAKQVLLTQGVYKVSNQVFGLPDKPNTCLSQADAGDVSSDCAEYSIRESLRSAFLAGFCEPDSKVTDNNCTSSFNRTRSLNTLTTKLNDAVDRQIQASSNKYLGVTITRADINALAHGDTRFYSLIGLQYAANTINKELQKDSKTSNHPKRAAFEINYNDIRSASGFGGLTDSEKLVAESNSAEDLMYESIRDKYPDELVYPTFASSGVNDVVLVKPHDGRPIADVYRDSVEVELRGAADALNSLGFPIDTNGDSQITDEEKNVFFSSDTGKKYVGDLANMQIASAKEKGIKQAEREKQRDSQEALKYKTFDALAFKADQNIPVNFTQRLFTGSQLAQASALAEYGMQSLFESNSSFREALKNTGIDPAQLGNFTVRLADALSKPSGERSAALTDLRTSVGTSFMAGVDTAFTNVLATKVFNTSVSKIPPGLFSGIYHWAEGGFTHNSLMGRQRDATGKLQSVGGIMDVYLTSFAYSWGDKQFGLKEGTTQKVSNVAKAAYTFYKLSRQGKVLTDAQKQQKLAAGDVIFTFAKDLLLSSLDKTLAANDAALGLPPGTLSQVLSLGLSYLAMQIGLIAFNPVGLILAGVGLLVSILFGVVKVEYVARATADGYYPFYKFGKGESGKKPQFSEHQTTDIDLGEFDFSNPQAYREGLKKAARAKVQGLARDLLLMPTSEFVRRNGLNPDAMWISQAFVWGDSSYNPLTDPGISTLLNRNAPWEDPKDYGYGLSDERCAFEYDETIDDMICTLKPTFKSGFFTSPLAAQAVHIRW